MLVGGVKVQWYKSLGLAHLEYATSVWQIGNCEHVNKCCRAKPYLPQQGNQTQVAGSTGKHSSYHVAVKAGFYPKAVECVILYLDPVTFTPSNLKFVAEFLGTVFT